jgi:dTDP-4-dehydrorhamnose 3,5-epimerase-like enzyme
MSFKKNKKFITKDETGVENGFLVPIYNVHDNFYPDGNEPKQVYLTVVYPGAMKGPHLHFIRTGCFTCIKGNVRIVLKVDGAYKQYYSGEKNDYLSVVIPTGVPAVLQNISNEDAYVLNMPYPAWTPEMNDEHTETFDDFDFETF